MEMSSLANVVSSQRQASVDNQRAMFTVKKSQDVAKEQAQALVDLVKQSGEVGTKIDVYA